MLRQAIQSSCKLVLAHTICKKYGSWNLCRRNLKKKEFIRVLVKKSQNNLIHKENIFFQKFAFLMYPYKTTIRYPFYKIRVSDKKYLIQKVWTKIPNHLRLFKKEKNLYKFLDPKKIPESEEYIIQQRK